MGNSGDSIIRENERILELLDREISRRLLNAQTVSTLTIFDGDVPIALLKSRVKDIVEKNPWLGGNLVTHKGKVVVKYAIERIDAYKFVTVHDFYSEERLHPSSFSTVEDYFNAYEQFCVKKGNQAIDNGETLFAVHVFMYSINKFGLLVSISHILSDGHTFYNIYAMLDEKLPVRALIATRDEDLAKQVTEKIEVSQNLFVSVPVAMNLLTKMTLFGTKRIQAHYLNMAHIDTAKTDYKTANTKNNSVYDLPSPQFISTNDIVCSTFFNSTNCDVGVMPVDFRNRVVGLSDNHAGNYEGIIAYQQSDYCKPESIRMSITSNDFKSISGTVPESFLERLFLDLAFVTNWCNFYHEIEFTGARHVLHLPIFAIKKIPMHAAVLFHASKHRVALMTFEQSQWSDTQKLKESDVIGAPVI